MTPNPWIFIWIIVWILALGVPNYLFKKGMVAYHKKPWQHILWYGGCLAILIRLYHNPFFENYFYHIHWTFWMVIAGIFLIWALIPSFYVRDFFTREERWSYQIVKFFEILFQQLGFLAGFLTFNLSPLWFALIFFSMHIPLIFFLPKRFAIFFTASSILGGIAFAFLQHQNMWGFTESLILHLTFYALLHYVLSRTYFIHHGEYKR